MKLRYLFVILAAFALSAGLISCGDDIDDGQVTVAVTSVSLEPDKTIIEAGIEVVTFTITVNPASELLKARVINKDTGNALTGTVFSSTTPGSYIFYAECCGVRSPEVTISVTNGEDPDEYASFKHDATLRFEWPDKDKLVNEESNNHFYRDSGLFLSDKCKVGYSNADATAYFMLEWYGDGTEGVKESPSVRTENGTEDLYALEILKSENGIIWIVYRGGENTQDAFTVQEW